MKRGMVLTLALALVLVFALGTVAMAVPGNGNAGGNNNPLGELRSGQTGPEIAGLIADAKEGIADGTLAVYGFENFGDVIDYYKDTHGFK